MSAESLTPLGAPHKPSYISQLLLYGFALALLACIVGGGILYLYSTFTQVVSDLRRSMNAATYTVQIYFDRREVALQNVATAFFKRPRSDTATATGTPDVDALYLLPVAPTGQQSEWVLPLTQHSHNSLEQLHVKLLFTSLRTGQTHYLNTSNDATAPMPSIPETQQLWIAQYLASVTVQSTPENPFPILWLRPPDDEQDRLFLYTPLSTNRSTIRSWIGMEVDTSTIFALPPSHDVYHPNYLLLNANYLTVMKNGVYIPPTSLISEQLKRIQGDIFHVRWKDSLPQYLVLSKTLGENGWRIVYYVRVSDVLRQDLLPVYSTLIIVLLLCTLVWFSVRLLHNRLILPANQQYVTIQEGARFMRLIMASAPVGLCLLNRQNAEPLYSNELANTWLAQEDPQWLINALAYEEKGVERTLKDGQSLSIDFVPMFYHGQAMQLCAITDISALKQVEYSLLAAKQKALSAYRAKSEFLATMSHEIRTPLFGIMGTLELLSLTQLTSHQTQYLRTIQHSSTTLLRTLNETLDISRIESSTENLQLAPLSPASIVNSVVASYADRAQNKGILLYSLVDSATPDFVIGDELRIRQILNNLVSNAIKFTVGGHITLRLYVKSASAGMLNLRFQVTDTGIGISVKDQQRLFDAYHQATDSASLQTDGSGLGLFICQRLATLMRGSLSLRSEPGLGSSISFNVELPVHSTATPATALQPERFFVQGDIPEMVQNLCEWLNRWGLIATPYSPQSGQLLPPHAVLIDAWPLHTPHQPLEWSGRHIILLPPGQIPEKQDTPLLWYSNAYDLSSLYDTVQQAQNNKAISPCAVSTFSSSSVDLDKHVVVVDDNDINRHIFEEQLHRLGCTVTQAADGLQALQLLQHLNPDLILTDINMPGMDGYTLSQTLRQQGFKKPIIGITAAIVNDQRQLAREAGMSDLLARPISLQSLYDILLSTTLPQTS